MDWFGLEKDYFHVGYGQDLVDMFERNQYAEVEAIHKHPKYDKNSKYFNDIALIKISPLTFNETVQPACLPDHHEDHYDGPLQVRSVAGFS